MGFLFFPQIICWFTFDKLLQLHLEILLFCCLQVHLRIACRLWRMATRPAACIWWSQRTPIGLCKCGVTRDTTQVAGLWSRGGWMALSTFSGTGKHIRCDRPLTTLRAFQFWVGGLCWLFWHYPDVKSEWKANCLALKIFSHHHSLMTQRFHHINKMTSF